MKISKYKTLKTLGLFFCLALFSFSSIAQDNAQFQRDSILKESYKELDISQISTLLSKIKVNSLEVIEGLVSGADIKIIEIRNDKLISALSVDLTEHPASRKGDSRRRLTNDLLFWKQHLILIEEKISELSILVKEAEDRISELEDDEKNVKIIKELIVSEGYSTAIVKGVKDDLKIIRNSKNLAIENKDDILFLLNSILDISSEITERIAITDISIADQEEKLFVYRLDNLFTIDYLDEENWNSEYTVKEFFKSELVSLKSYVFLNYGSFFLNILVIIGFVTGFSFINNNYNAVEGYKTSIYKKYFIILLKRPISLAFSLGIFSSVLIYSNMPLLLKDIFRLLIFVPLLFTLQGLLNKRYHKYIYVLISLIILHLVYILFPAGKLTSRLILIVVSIVEFIVIIDFIRIQKREFIQSIILRNGVYFVSMLALGMVVIGFLSNVIGYAKIAETVLFMVYLTVSTIALLVVTVIVFNGFLFLMVRGRYSEKINAVKKNRDIIISRVTRLINLVTLLAIIHYVLRMIGVNKFVLNGIIDWLEMKRTIGSLTYTTGGFILFFVVIWLSTVISNIARIILEEDVLVKMKLEKGLPHTISVMVKYSIVTIGVIIAMTSLGLPFSEFAMIFSAFGVGIGFGLQNIINNLVSGMILLFERPIKIGDTIEVGTLLGEVKSIGIRSSNIRTFDGAEIIVPNGSLISREVINWTLSDQRRRIELIVGVSYSSDPKQVSDILMKVIKTHPDIVSYPLPYVFFNEMNSSSLDFRMLFWTLNFDDWIRIKSDITFSVFEALSEAGIEIPFPQQDLHLRTVDSEILEKKA
ncbi:MAG: mechanosensitive ion channel [Flavobacteriales bacterium]|nr:mechanosensitive ion channel [Flavobacteriales bacterium]